MKTREEIEKKAVKYVGLSIAFILNGLLVGMNIYVWGFLTINQ